MAKNNNLTDFLTSIADKIREKLGIANAINPQDFEDNIDKISDSSYFNIISINIYNDKYIKDCRIWRRSI